MEQYKSNLVDVINVYINFDNFVFLKMLEKYCI